MLYYQVHFKLFKIKKLDLLFQNSKFKIQNSKFKIQNSKFKIQNSKFKLWTLFMFGSCHLQEQP
jgi:hypothetical protein